MVHARSTSLLWSRLQRSSLSRLVLDAGYYIDYRNHVCAGYLVSFVNNLAHCFFSRNYISLNKPRSKSP